MKERAFSGTKNPKEQAWEREHRKIARKAAAEGIVLLKNENHVLPLKKGSTVSLYGAGAGQTVKGGTGSGDVNERESVTIWQGMKEAGYVIANEEWLRDYDCRYQEARDRWKADILKRTAGKKEDAVSFFGIYSTTPFLMPAGKAVEKPKNGTDRKHAFYILSRMAGEGSDRLAVPGDYYLAEEEHRMLSDICSIYEEVIVVINAGAQVDLSFMDEFENIHALFYIVQPGMEGGRAFAEVVSGKVNPSGKLTDTWAYRYEDYPNAATFSHNDGKVDAEVYTEGIYVGYRYFDSFGIDTRYGFGYGLSYTAYSIQDMQLEKEGKSGLRVTATIENTGSMAGKEILQVYASLPGGRLAKEARRLIGYAKTREIHPGEFQTVEVEISIEQFASYDDRRAAWILEPGTYGIWVGSSLAEAVLFAGVETTQEILLLKVKQICPPRQEIHELSQSAELCVKREADVQRVLREKELPIIELSDGCVVTVEYKQNSELFAEGAMKLVDSLSIEDCIKLAIGDPGRAQGGNLGAAGITVPGSAGETHGCAVEKGLPSIVLADGPAGLRLMKFYHVDSGKIVSVPFQFSLEGGIFCDNLNELPGERYYQYCTAIPVGTLLAQTWDMGLIQEVGDMIGREMEYYGINLWLAPGMNIHRNPLCGRSFEYYSEDPYVSGTIAAAMTRGVQRHSGCGTTIKHFACNNQEANRMASDSVVSERALREIYLKGFEIAVKSSQPRAIMTSYNLINGIHAANNRDICTDAARNEWGFKGVIMTDWTTTQQDDMCTASGCIRAGNDLIMPGSYEDYDNLRKELEEGSLKPEELRACIARLVVLLTSCRKACHMESEPL